jgi:hypothetical protein
MTCHTGGNYTLDGFKKLTEGSSCTVYTGNFLGKKYVLKTYDFSDKDLWKELIRQNIRLRNILSKYIRVPKILEIGSEDGFYIIEEYLGRSLKEYFYEDSWDLDHIEDLKECIDIISTFPEDIPIDANPANFVIDDFGMISFIDFMPPDPWAFLDTPKFRIPFEKVFPHVIRAYERREVRKKRYYLNKYRIVKLLHYLDITQ